MTLTGSDHLWLVALACGLAAGAALAIALLAVHRSRLRDELAQCRRQLERMSAAAALSEQIPAMIAYVDRDMRNFYHTQTYREWLGLSREQVEGRHVREILGEDAYRAIEGTARNALAGHEGTRAWSRVKDGRTQHVESRLVPHLGEHGEVLGYYALLRDVSQKRMVQDALLESEAQLRAIFDQAAVGIAQMGPDGHFRQANMKLCAMLGYTKEELRELTFRQITHPDDLNANMALHRRYVAGEVDSYTFEERYLRKDGQPLWISMALSKVYDEGRRAESIVVVQDISARKAAEERLRQVDRARRVMAECSHVLVQANDKVELLRNMCRTAVEDGGYLMAFAGLADDDGGKSVRPVAQAGLDDGYLAAARLSWEDDERGRGPSAQALRSGKPCVVRNCFIDPRMENEREAALARGFHSCISLPLLDKGLAFGVLNLYAS